ncbi:MAG TPA: (2Fe-2S) ferredoxin domain-containing protein [Mucilaginibacter sp.]|nr:(2Fe-2S) ferredoxin domain-containing protein [Mucilaginibacter sp.]
MGKFTVPERAVYICTGSKCGKRGGKNLYKILKAYAKHSDEFEPILTECTDRCKFAPICSIQPDNIWLKEYSEKDVLKLLHKLSLQKD